MMNSTFHSLAGLAALIAHGTMEFAPITAEAAHCGRLIVLGAEAIIFLWQHRAWLRRTNEADLPVEEADLPAEK